MSCSIADVLHARCTCCSVLQCVAVCCSVLQMHCMPDTLYVRCPSPRTALPRGGSPVGRAERGEDSAKSEEEEGSAKSEEEEGSALRSPRTDEIMLKMITTAKISNKFSTEYTESPSLKRSRKTNRSGDRNISSLICSVSSPRGEASFVGRADEGEG